MIVGKKAKEFFELISTESGALEYLRNRGMEVPFLREPSLGKGLWVRSNAARSIVRGVDPKRKAEPYCSFFAQGDDEMKQDFINWGYLFFSEDLDVLNSFSRKAVDKFGGYLHEFKTPGHLYSPTLIALWAEMPYCSVRYRLPSQIYMARAACEYWGDMLGGDSSAIEHIVDKGVTALEINHTSLNRIAVGYAIDHDKGSHVIAAYCPPKNKDSGLFVCEYIPLLHPEILVGLDALALAYSTYSSADVFTTSSSKNAFKFNAIKRSGDYSDFSEIVEPLAKSNAVVECSVYHSKRVEAIVRHALEHQLSGSGIVSFKHDHKPHTSIKKITFFDPVEQKFIEGVKVARENLTKAEEQVKVMTKALAESKLKLANYTHLQKLNGLKNDYT